MLFEQHGAIFVFKTVPQSCYEMPTTKFASQRRKKRKFYGNRFTKYNQGDCVNEGNSFTGLQDEFNSPNTAVDDPAKETLSASYKKLKVEIKEKKLVDKLDGESTAGSRPMITGFRLFDMDILCNVLSMLRCHQCGELNLLFMEDEINRKGCTSSLRLLCENCGWKHSFYTSKQQGKSFEVNRRIVYGMRTLGKGQTGAKKFCSLMNMPPPPAAKNYAKISGVITSCLRYIAKESMNKAAEEVESAEPVNCGVSLDGTWQKRGFSSRNGCVTAISIDTGKILDVEILSQACKQCALHEHLDKNSLEYLRWRADHVTCKANFKGSAPAMEPEGVDRIFRRSVELHNLQYTEYYGDGDSKSFSKVKDVYQASGITVQKKECIGHVQKRVGTALRKLKRENRGMGGRGKLTDGIIDKLQNYYGIAIRANVGDLAGMKKAIHASLMHCVSSESRPLHDHCPTGSTSWCRYQQDKANRTSLYKHGPGLPVQIIGKLKPEYVRLSEDSLLEKCLHGKTQNRNEAVNGMIWQRIPKEVYVGRETLEMGVYDAVAYFNIGTSAVLTLFHALGIPPGKFTEAGCRQQDQVRVHLAQRKSRPDTKKRRKVLRGLRKRKDDKRKEAEGVNYASGQF